MVMPRHAHLRKQLARDTASQPWLALEALFCSSLPCIYSCCLVCLCFAPLCWSLVPCCHLGRHFGHLVIELNSIICKSDWSLPVILSSWRSQQASPDPANLTDPFSRLCLRSHRGLFVEILPLCFVHRSRRLASVSINSWSQL